MSFLREGQGGYAGFLTGLDLYVFLSNLVLCFFFKILNSALIIWHRVCVSFDLWFCTAGSSVGVLFRLYLIGLHGLKACLVGEIEFGEFLVSIC